VLQDLAVNPRYQREGGRGIDPTSLAIEHTFILEHQTDTLVAPTNTNLVMAEFGGTYLVKMQSRDRQVINL
jgi:hypothetical protein